MGRDIFGRSLSPLVKPALSAEPASWLHSRLLPWGRETGTRVCAVVPGGFEAYTRILHPAFGPGPDSPPIRWSTVAAWAGCVVHAEMQWEPMTEPIPPRHDKPPWYEEPQVGWCESHVMLPLCEQLVNDTSTPESVWFAMWIGYPDVKAVMKGAPQFELPAREYILLNGPVSAAAEIITAPYPRHTGPSLWWPDDLAWCVATEIDFRWTYVGGTESCINRLESDSRLETLRTHPDHRGDSNSDWVNDTVQPSEA